jgi:uncharacterized protein (DUF433 family)
MRGGLDEAPSRKLLSFLEGRFLEGMENGLDRYAIIDRQRARSGWGTCWENYEAEAMEKLERITVRPEVCLGQPTIRGMRITVSVILKLLAAGKSVADVLAAYPELEEEDVRQAMQYAAWVLSDQIQVTPG